MTVIIDMDNVGMSMLWGPGMEMIAYMGKVVQDNYPEVIKRSFIVNSELQYTLWEMLQLVYNLISDGIILYTLLLFVLAE